MFWAESSSCPAGWTATLVLPRPDETANLALAKQAGCKAAPTTTVRQFHHESYAQRCCPSSLEIPRVQRTGDGESCEDARAKHEVTPQRPPPQARGGATTPTRERFVPENYAHLFAECEIASDLQVFICVAVREGAAEGVTVETVPPTRGTAEGLVRVLRRLEFPSDPSIDVIHVSL